MNKRFTFGKLNITLTLRHYWETDSRLINISTFRQKQLGIWYSKTKAISTKYEGKEMFTKKDNLANSYSFGIRLLYIFTWINIDYGVKHFKIKNYE